MRMIKFPTKISIKLGIFPKYYNSFTKDLEKKFKTIKLASANWELSLFGQDFITLEYESLNNLKETIRIVSLLKRRRTVKSININIENFK